MSSENYLRTAKKIIRRNFPSSLYDITIVNQSDIFDSRHEVKTLVLRQFPKKGTPRIKLMTNITADEKTVRIQCVFSEHGTLVWTIPITKKSRPLQTLNECVASLKNEKLVA